MRTDFKKVLTLLEQLHKEYPGYSIAKHIATATMDYGDIWTLSDKELFILLKSYKSILPPEPKEAFDKFVNEIEEDGKHVFEDGYLNEEEED